MRGEYLDWSGPMRGLQCSSLIPRRWEETALAQPARSLCRGKEINLVLAVISAPANVRGKEDFLYISSVNDQIYPVFYTPNGPAPTRLGSHRQQSYAIKNQWVQRTQ